MPGGRLHWLLSQKRRTSRRQWLLSVEQRNANQQTDADDRNHSSDSSLHRVLLHCSVSGKNAFNSLTARSSCGSDVNMSSAGDCNSIAVGESQLEIATVSGMTTFAALLLQNFFCIWAVAPATAQGPTKTCAMKFFELGLQLHDVHLFVFHGFEFRVQNISRVSG